MPVTRKQKAGSTIGGGLGGAATGAALGSIVPGIGTALGALLGGALGGAGSYLGGEPTQQAALKSQKKQNALNKLGNINKQQGNLWTGTPAGLDTYNVLTPQQQEISNLLLQQGKKGLENYSQFNFAPIEQAARQGFSQKTLPSLAERFTALGSGPNSGAFNRAAASAGKDLELQLAGLKENYGLKQQQMLHGLLGLGLSPQVESFYRQADPGFKAELMNSLAQGLITPENIQAALQFGGQGIQKLREYIASKRSPQDQGMQQQDVSQQQQQFQVPALKSSYDIMQGNIANIGSDNPQLQQQLAQLQPQQQWSPYSLYSDTLHRLGYNF